MLGSQPYQEAAQADGVGKALVVVQALSLESCMASDDNIPTVWISLSLREGEGLSLSVLEVLPNPTC